MTDYSNSHASKEKKEHEKLKPVAKGSLKKESWWATILDGDFETLKSRIVKDVVVPIARNSLDTLFTNASHVIFGGGKYSNVLPPANNVRYVDYHGASNRNVRIIEAIPEKQILGTTDYNRVRYDSEEAAQSVVLSIKAAIGQYGFASVGDMYDCAGLSNSPTDYKYGWTNVDDAQVYRNLDGYFIKWPKVMPID